MGHLRPAASHTTSEQVCRALAGFESHLCCTLTHRALLSRDACCRDARTCAGVPCVFSFDGCHAELSGVCDDHSPPAPPPAVPPPLPECPSALGIQFRVSSSTASMFTASVKVESPMRKLTLRLDFGRGITISNIWGAQPLPAAPGASASGASLPNAAAASQPSPSASRRVEDGRIAFISPTGKSGLLKFFGFTGSNISGILL